MLPDCPALPKAAPQPPASCRLSVCSHASTRPGTPAAVPAAIPCGAAGASPLYRPLAAATAAADLGLVEGHGGVGQDGVHAHAEAALALAHLAAAGAQGGTEAAEVSGSALAERRPPWEPAAPPGSCMHTIGATGAPQTAGGAPGGGAVQAGAWCRPSSARSRGPTRISKSVRVACRWRGPGAAAYGPLPAQLTLSAAAPLPEPTAFTALARGAWRCQIGNAGSSGAQGPALASSPSLLPRSQERACGGPVARRSARPIRKRHLWSYKGAGGRLSEPLAGAAVPHGAAPRSKCIRRNWRDEEKCAEKVRWTI